MTKGAVSERGSYRAIYETLYDDLDFQRLTPLAKLVWHVLKVKLTQYGIAVFYPEVLPRLVGTDRAMIESALVELEEPKPGQNLGWLVREEHVFWLVNAFRFDPTVGGGVSENHKIGARRYAETLPKLRVVQQFLSYYGLAATASKPATTIGRAPPTHPPPHTPRVGFDSNRVGGNRESDTERERESESEMGSPTPPVAGLPDPVARFVARFYGSASEERRQEVIGQLRATIGPGLGARVKKGVHAKARGINHLTGCCLDVMSDPPNNSDVAIVWVLKKLNDPELDSRGHTVTEAASDQYKRDDKLFTLYHEEKTAAGRAWARENPDRWKEIEAAVDAQLGNPGQPLYDTIRKTRLADVVGDNAGFPSYEEWLAGREAMAT